MRGFTSDDEDSMSGLSGSGSGCFEVPEIGPCDCEVLRACLQTCSDDQCSLDLADCYTKYIGSKNCHEVVVSGEENITAIMENAFDADSSESTWLVTGGVASVVLLTAAVLMIALRNKTGCCRREHRRENGQHVQTICYRPDRPNPDSAEYDRILVQSLYANIPQRSHDAATVTKEEHAPVATFNYQSSPKQLGQTNQNDYQTLPETSTTHESFNSKGIPGSLHTYGKETDIDSTEVHVDDCYQTISDLPPSYQHVIMNEVPQINTTESNTYYQSMTAKNHSTDTCTERPHSDCYVAMDEPVNASSDSEYTVMQESGHRESDVHAAVTENVYYGNDVGETYVNEPLERTVIDKSSKVKALNEDEVYEKMEF